MKLHKEFNWIDLFVNMGLIGYIAVFALAIWLLK
jgi:hypothetical protein